MDRFNEVKLVLIMYHIICFTAFVPDSETKFLIGYSCMGFILIGLLINMFDLITSPFYAAKHGCRLRFHKNKAKKECRQRKFDTKGFNKRRMESYIKMQKEMKHLYESMAYYREIQKEAYYQAKREALAREPRLEPNALLKYIQMGKMPERPHGIDLLKEKVRKELEFEAALDDHINKEVEKFNIKRGHTRQESRDLLISDNTATPRGESNGAGAVVDSSTNEAKSMDVP